MSEKITQFVLRAIPNDTDLLALADPVLGDNFKTPVTAFVRQGADEDIDGEKNFTSLPTLPPVDPVNDVDAASKGYVDTEVAAGRAYLSLTSPTGADQTVALDQDSALIYRASVNLTSASSGTTDFTLTGLVNGSEGSLHIRNTDTGNDRDVDLTGMGDIFKGLGDTLTILDGETLIVAWERDGIASETIVVTA